MKSGKRPTIFGNGTKARDYTFVQDIARANILALRYPKNSMMNLGWGNLITDQMIFDAIARETRFAQKPIYAPYRKGETYQIALDASRAKKILGWKPKVKFEEGIRETLKTI
jgi:UDP-glucose 4-epimerase